MPFVNLHDAELHLIIYNRTNIGDTSIRFKSMLKLKSMFKNTYIKIKIIKKHAPGQYCMKIKITKTKLLSYHKKDETL